MTKYRNRHYFIDDDSTSEDGSDTANTDKTVKDKDDEAFYFAGRTKDEILEGQKRHLDPEMLNLITFHALTNGYSALVPPSLQEFLHLLKSVSMPVAKNHKALNEACCQIIVHAISHHMSQARWSGLLQEQFNLETMKYTLLISEALANEVSSKGINGFSYRLAQAHKSRSLLDQHAACDYRFLPVSRAPYPDGHSWSGLVRDVVNRLVVSPTLLDSLPAVAARPSLSSASILLPTQSPQGGDGIPSPWGPPMHITPTDAANTRDKYFGKFFRFMTLLAETLKQQQQEGAAASSGSKKSQRKRRREDLERHLEAMLEFNLRKTTVQEGVDYEGWVKDAITKGLIVEE